MFRLHYLVLSAFTLYFVTFVTGCPGMVPATPTRVGADAPDAKVDKARGTGTSQVESELREFENKRRGPELVLGWQPGLIETVPMQRRALADFRDTVLESEARPDRLLRTLERSLTGDSLLFALAVFWSVALCLCMFALYRRHWFYQNMLFLLVPASMMVILLLLLGPRQAQLLTPAGMSGIFLARVYLESLLLFGGMLIVFQRVLPVSSGSRLSETRFMGYMRVAAVPARARLGGLFQITGHMTLIILAGLVLANLLLLPIYTLQLSFPRFFAALLVLGLVVLVWFYTRAYFRVSKEQTDDSTIPSAVSFLGFRIVRNTVVLSSVFVLVMIAVGVIVIIAWMNIGALQSWDILKRPSTL